MNSTRLSSYLRCCLLLLVALCSGTVTAQEKIPSDAQTILIGGNTWQQGGKPGRSITKTGIRSWSGASAHYQTFVRLNKPGSLKVWLGAQVPAGKSTLELTIGGKSKTIKLDKQAGTDVFAGEWQIVDTGYVAINLSGLQREGDVFADVNHYRIAGSAVTEGARYVKNDEGNFFYWGRRGPSVHMAYQVPKGQDIQYYYNEITVPEGEDVIGSYYMANGFSGGYFGIQVNSESERRILFSVWSPFVTDNPAEIPEEDRIKLLKKGKDVYTGEFGNEGSGGQSFLRYNWKAGTTYKFLLKGEPVDNNYTVYTAWFFAPELDEWQLIASFSRPKTNSWLTGFHSFLENFNPDQGILERKVLFSNQWVVNKEGQWTETSCGKFTADNTARTGFRMDYAGGVDNGHFYLRNCGFFDDYTPIDSFFERPVTGQRPKVDLEKLP